MFLCTKSKSFVNTQNLVCVESVSLKMGPNDAAQLRINLRQTPRDRPKSSRDRPKSSRERPMSRNGSIRVSSASTNAGDSPRLKKNVIFTKSTPPSERKGSDEGQNVQTLRRRSSTKAPDTSTTSRSRMSSGSLQSARSVPQRPPTSVRLSVDEQPESIKKRQSVSSRGRQNSNTSQSQDNVKNSISQKRRRHRPTVYKSLQSDEDSDSSNSDSEIGSVSQRTTSTTPNIPPSPASAETTESQRLVWDQFDEHIRNIDEFSTDFTQNPRKTFKSSDIFQSVMFDLHGNTEYGKSRGFTKFSNTVGHVSTFASRFLGRMKTAHMNGMLNDEKDEMDAISAGEIMSVYVGSCLVTISIFSIIRLYNLSQNIYPDNMSKLILYNFEFLTISKYSLRHQCMLVPKPTILHDRMVLETVKQPCCS